MLQLVIFGLMQVWKLPPHTTLLNTTDLRLLKIVRSHSLKKSFDIKSMVIGSIMKKQKSRSVFVIKKRQDVHT